MPLEQLHPRPRLASLCGVPGSRHELTFLQHSPRVTEIIPIKDLPIRQCPGIPAGQSDGPVLGRPPVDRPAAERVLAGVAI